MKETNTQNPGQSLLSGKERRVKRALQFNLLSDTFMSLCLKDKAACEYVLRILTGIKDLSVKEVRTQARISKLTSHDAILDAFAEDSHGRLHNIEIQRNPSIDHARRTRFYGSMIDSEFLEKGKTYAELPDVYVIYISETDIWAAGYTSYPINKYLGETRRVYDDGMHVLYVNAAVDDGTETARLMHFSKETSPEDHSHGALSERVCYLKCEEGGYKEMCTITDEIYQEGLLDGRQEGISEGKTQTAKIMHSRGFGNAEIADILQVSVQTVTEWLSESSISCISS